jgi:hypothetical protein
VIIVFDVEQAEADLTAGRLACPRCAAPLRPWSWAAVRRVRGRDGTSRSVRPRRARCTSCRASQVLLPAWCQPRLADATEVIGAALVAKRPPDVGTGPSRPSWDARRLPCAAGCGAPATHCTWRGCAASVSTTLTAWTPRCSPMVSSRSPPAWATRWRHSLRRCTPGGAGGVDTPTGGHSSER